MTPVFFYSFLKTDNTTKFLIFIKNHFDKVSSIVTAEYKNNSYSIISYELKFVLFTSRKKYVHNKEKKCDNY